jgi:hypothetical protein
LVDLRVSKKLFAHDFRKYFESINKLMHKKG